MFAASLVLWVGVPLGWLFVGGRVQGATHSLGAAVAVVMAGVIATVAAFVPLLGWLSRKHAEARFDRGLQDLGSAALEGVMVMSALVALVAFGVWFFFLSGAEPIPLNLPK
jgi:hypothetical protein